MTKNQQSDLELDGAVFDDKLTEKKAADLLKELADDQEVLKLAHSLDEKNQIEVLEFGKEPAEQISRFSDQILKSMHVSNVEDSGELLKQLNRIMDKFDRNDFKHSTGGVFGKLFKRGEKMIEKLFKKYQSIGGEIDKVYIEISKYKNELVEMTHMLENMYEENYQYYVTLEKYIAAGHIKLEEVKSRQLPVLEERALAGDEAATMELDSIKKAVELLEQRTYDLEMAKMVALQTAPQIRLLQRGNTKLIGKINSAFVTTIPIFKNGMIHAISAKRQKIVADSMEELDRRTNEMLLRNAQNISVQSKEIAKLAGKSSIKIETLEETMKVILEGMEETLLIEEENRRQREEGRKKLEQLQETFRNHMESAQ